MIQRVIAGHWGWPFSRLSRNGGVVSANSVHHNKGNGIEGGNVGPFTASTVNISGNDVFANRIGVNVSYGSQGGGGYTISGNTIHNNTETDVALTSTFKNTVAVGNTVYGAPTGILLTGAAEARGNTVYDHVTGITTNTGFVTGNRVFRNTGLGIRGDYAATVSGNTVYSNAGGGIAGDYVPNAAGAGPYYRNNLVYANNNFGIQLTGGREAFIENNTV